MSVGVIKSTEGTEHSHVPRGGCFGEYLFININAVRWDGQTIENTACVPFFSKSSLINIRNGRVSKLVVV